MIYKKHNKICKQREKNDSYLKVFEEDLIRSNLTQKTILRHLDNVDFYINGFLIREEPLDIKDECGSMLELFLGHYFIYKCMWSSPNNLKTTAASIKKFYKSMSDYGHVSKECYLDICDTIKENLKLWQEKCRVFNS